MQAKLQFPNTFLPPKHPFSQALVAWWSRDRRLVQPGMKSKLLVFPLIFVLFSAALTTGVSAAEPQWKASWITHPTAPLREPIVLHFRRSLKLETKPARYVVHVSADNRFVLYVNGHRVGDGPARGDLAHWRYETFDLAAYLAAGSNLVTATVWNFGIYAPTAQITDRTAFLLQGDGATEADLNTPKGWMVAIEPGRIAVPRTPGGVDGYMANGPGEELNAAAYDWQWNDPGDSSRAWVAAGDPMRENIYPSAARAGLQGEQVDNYWQLVPDELPPMTYTPTEAGEVVRSDQPGAEAFPGKPIAIPANRHVHVLLDRKTLTTAYPQLTVSGGKGANIRLTYAEALYDAKQDKGDRNDVGNRQALGVHDRFLPDGGQHRTFEPLWWRVWRYLDLDIQTGAEPLTLESLQGQYTAYPFEERASFDSKDADLKQIWDISWRTAQLDAHETYMDTPYWEQLQYVGDTRIQALISYAVTGDDRLAKQAIQNFDNSRIPEGLTQSRYPTSQPQIIPTFSLLWIDMLHDYWLYRPDTSPVKAALPGTRTVLTWFAQYEQPDGLLRKTPWWSFVDWVSTGELPTYDGHGESCTTTLEYLGALTDAAELERAVGDKDRATQEEQRAQHVRSGLYDKCWDRGAQAAGGQPGPHGLQPANEYVGGALRCDSTRGATGCLAAIGGHRSGDGAGRSSERVLLFSLLPGARAGTRGDGRRISLHLEALARSVAAPFQHLAGDAGKDAVRFACLERASHLRSADPGGWGRAGIAGLRHRADCSAPGGSP